MPSYRCELKGTCGEMMKVAVWNDRFILECERAGFSEIEHRPITVPYVKQVRQRCEMCPLVESPIEL
ncbi:MAG TPA: hypothetical protein VM050_05995 [Patescibacteria group bacterium]|nr:hypothetical protein [Patescibacteria group bacterium]